MVNNSTVEILCLRFVRFVLPGNPGVFQLFFWRERNQLLPKACSSTLRKCVAWECERYVMSDSIFPYASGQWIKSAVVFLLEMSTPCWELGIFGEIPRKASYLPSLNPLSSIKKYQQGNTRKVTWPWWRGRVASKMKSVISFSFSFILFYSYVAGDRKKKLPCAAWPSPCPLTFSQQWYTCVVIIINWFARIHERQTKITPIAKSKRDKRVQTVRHIHSEIFRTFRNMVKTLHAIYCKCSWNMQKEVN